MPPDVNVIETKIKVKKAGGNYENKLEKERKKFEEEKNRILGEEDINEKKAL